MTERQNTGVTLTAVDLFSGCGGMSLGFQKAGFDVLAAFDFWAPAVEVYRKNFTDDSEIVTAANELRRRKYN